MINKLLSFGLCKESVKKHLKVLSLLFILISCLLSPAFSQDAVSKALSLLNKQLILENYEKAYNYAQFIMNYYNNENIPDDALVSVKDAVTKKSEALAEKQLWDSLISMEDDLKDRPAEIKACAEPSIKKAKQYFINLEEEKERKKQEELKLVEEVKRNEEQQKLKAERNAENEKLLKLFDQQQETARRQAQMEKERHEAELKYREELSQIMKEMNESNNEAVSKVSSNNKTIIFIFVFIILLFVVLITIIVLLTFRQQKNTQEQMKNTILAMQAMRVTSQLNSAMPLPLQNIGISDSGVSGKLENKTLSIEDSSVNNISPEAAGEDALKNLLKICQQYGEQIDVTTGRKNVSSRVAELVYKICRKLNISEYEASIYYAASLVYDIGFLSIDSSILHSETITEADFELIKTHTSIGPNMVFFADEQYRNIFKDAAGKHHENLDGTGYPNGLKGNQIPFIARVIRVVESYIALISSRQYKQIRDRNEAITELRNNIKNYDEQIINTLDSIV